MVSETATDTSQARRTPALRSAVGVALQPPLIPGGSRPLSPTNGDLRRGDGPREIDHRTRTVLIIVCRLMDGSMTVYLLGSSSGVSCTGNRRQQQIARWLRKYHSIIHEPTFHCPS
jgi:hypothetical protein